MIHRLLGRFIGREETIAAIRAYFETRRLVTLVGPPGMGKTRLALRYAELHQAGEAFVCDLTEAKNASDLASNVARTLGKPLRAHEDLRAAIEHTGSVLAEAGPLLLIVDNLETIATEAAPILEEWCAIAPEALLLVTSRVRLGIAGECIIDLPPLDLETDAVALYLERAGGGGSSAERLEDHPHVRALVRALDGIPLAIELAAARSNVLGPDKLLARLRSKKADVLATLRAAIDSSWELLSAEEKSVLQQCSIFAGDFTFEAVEGVVRLPVKGRESSGEQRSLLDLVTALHDKSLLRSRQTHLSLYASIREYAAEKEAASSSSSSDRDLSRRYRKHYLAVTSEPFARFSQFGDEKSRGELAAEKENLLAIQHALAARLPDDDLDADERVDLARVVRHLEPTIATEKTFEDLIAILDSGLVAIQNAEDEDEIAGHLYIARGNAYGLRAHFAASLADLERACDIGRKTKNPVLEAEARIMASVRYRHQGRFDDARAAGEEALRLLDGKNEARVEGAGRAVLGLLFCELGLNDESRRENLRARSIFSAAGDRWSEALPLSNLGQLDQAAGEWETSAHAYDGALERFREHGDRRYESRYLGYRATLDLERGDRSSARAIFGTALEMLVALRIRHTEALFRACKGALEAMDGDVRLAMTELDRAADLLLAVEAPPPSIAFALEVHRGQLDVALAKTRSTESDAERLMESARDRLANARFKNQSEDVRFAMRLLERTLAGGGAAIAKEPAARRDRHHVDLVLGPEARWFEVPPSSAERVDLSRRAALRLLLRALVDRHANAPDTTLSSDALLAIGWPGEKVLAMAGSTRVRVAISTLRRLGLARLLITRDDGYLLDPKGIFRSEGAL